jgi:DNA-binding LytR/AlgR family response regulator
MTLLRVLAIDDEPPALSEIQFLLSELPNVGKVTAASSPIEVSEAFANGSFDVVLLDIEMADESGLEVAARIRALPIERRPAIVFVTAYAEHAVQAFELDAVDYVLKPVRRERLAQAFQRVVDRNEGTRPAPAQGGPATPDQSRIPIDIGGRTVFVERSSVAVVEASRDYVKLYVHKETRESGLKSYLYRTPISTLETAWVDAGFLRVHRGYLVALSEVRELRSDSHGTSIIVAGMEIPVGRTYLRVLKDRLLRSTPESTPESAAGQ